MSTFKVFFYICIQLEKYRYSFACIYAFSVICSKTCCVVLCWGGIIIFSPVITCYCFVDILQLEEERQAEVDHENRLLLQKMSKIMKEPALVDSWNEYHTKRLLSVLCIVVIKLNHSIRSIFFNWFCILDICSTSPR